VRITDIVPSGLSTDRRHGSRFAVTTATRASTITLLLAVPALVVLVALPAFASRVLLQELFYVFTMLALAQLWNLLAGSAGLISVGQQAFVGIGAYALFAFAVMTGLDLVTSIVLAGVVAGLIAVPAALIVFRLRGAYFAIGTWVVAEVCRLILAQVKQLGGGTGTSLPPDVASSIVGIDFVRNLFQVRGPAARDILSYWIALLLALGTFVLIYRLLRSRYGLALSAVGDAEPAAESAGVDVFRTKLFIYVITAAATGMVGALIFLQKARISPDAAFSLVDWTAYVIFIVVIGGIGTMEGPIIGVVIFYLLQYYLASLGSWYLIILGGLAILLMLFAPSGVWGVISQRSGISLFPVRRRLIVRDVQAPDDISKI
jgi:branched-chain amino acid transport system permease protein